MIPLSDKRSAVRYEIERRLAPHVEEKWAEAFVIELRLLDVPGDVLGAALAEVESHCVESGETAADAFGDPVAYAHDLDLPAQPAGRWELVTVLGPVGTQVLGMLVLGWGGGEVVRAWRTGGTGATVGLTVGMLCMVAGLCVAGLLVARHSATVLRHVLDRPVVSWLVVTLLTGSLGVGAVLLDGVIVAVPAAPAGAVGALTLAAGTVWSVVQVRRGTLDDPVVPPVTAAGEQAEEGRGAGARFLSSLVTWAVPLLALAPLGAAWFFAGS
ncbi:hypothetical protein ACFP63_12055 [Oerskovia jenensis]|uniref:Integral membrane protein n=1 Tax=Oerskovia jenensis TaxID=162169 RepID=A0ABS2LJW3_9CELL|nr:hypothetical protein [Oerskovia jenensis]MBM7480718.1 hypothetical protein [Oerskovia jenensis]